MDFEKIIVAFLTERVPNLKGIYLFGSRADGTARADSDFDIAVLTDRMTLLTAMQLFELAVELSALLGADVDLIDFKNVKIDFQFVIISTAKRLFCSDKTACETFEMLTYSMSQRFEEERKFIIQDIKKRGRIYG